MDFGLKKPVKSLLQLSSANVAVKILGVAMIAFLTRYLTKEELAILPVYEMLAALSLVFLGFGLQPTFIRLLPSKFEEDYEEARGLIYTGGLLLVGGSTVFACGVFFLSGWLSPLLFKHHEYGQVLKIISLGFVFVSFKNVSRLVLWSSSRFDKISLLQITTALGKALFVAGFLLLWGIEGLALGLVVNEVVGAVLSFYFIRDILQGPRVLFYPPGKLIKRSLPFYFEGFLIYFRSQGDNWIVATLLGPATMAIYFIAKRLPAMLMMFIESLDKVVTTEISRRKNQPAEMASYIRNFFLVNSHITLPGTVVIIGLVPLFILLVAGPEYMASVIPCIILCTVLPLQTYQIPIGRGIFVLRPPMVRVVMTFIESLVLIASLFFFIPPLAENGIALSRVTAAVAALIMAVAVLSRTLDLRLPWGQAARSAGLSLVLGIVIFGLQSWNDNLLFSPAFVLVGILVFLVLVHLFNAKAFYEAVNALLPFHLKDPVASVLKIFRRYPEP